MRQFYIQEVLENYYNISLEDKMRLIQMIKKLYSEHTYEVGISYHEILNTIELLTYKAYQSEKLSEFYNFLTSKQRKEFQTQTHIKAKEYKKGWFYELDRDHRLANLIFELDKPEEIIEKEPTYKIDFTRLEEEFGGDSSSNYSPTFSVSGLLQLFKKKFFYFSFGSIDFMNLTEEEKEEVYEKYTKPLLNEYYLAEKRFNDIVEENFSESTKTIYESLPDTLKKYTRFDMLDVDAEKLDCLMKKREYLDRISKEEYQRNLEETKKDKPKKKQKKYINCSNRCYR